MKDNNYDLTENLKKIIDISYGLICEKIEHGNITVDNEPSFQLHFGFILRTIGQLFELSSSDRFSIYLESYIDLHEVSVKSNTKRARCDILLTLENANEIKKCAIELKYFKKSNHREPNNRYDFFADLHNLENYKSNNFDLCYMIIGTDHSHYVNQTKYSDDTQDFDFRNKKKYIKGTKLSYNTTTPYGDTITLRNNYKFIWDIYKNNFFMKQEIQ